jgi:CHASE3 domain sensor protein
MMTKNLVVGHRIALGFSVPLAALMAPGVLSLHNLEQMRSQETAGAHSGEVMTELGELTSAVSGIESSGRGYFISGDNAIKTDFAIQHAQADESRRKLQALTTDDPAQQTRLDQLARDAHPAEASFGE